MSLIIPPELERGPDGQSPPTIYVARAECREGVIDADEFDAHAGGASYEELCADILTHILRRKVGDDPDAYAHRQEAPRPRPSAFSHYQDAQPRHDFQSNPLRMGAVSQTETYPPKSKLLFGVFLDALGIYVYLSHQLRRILYVILVIGLLVALGKLSDALEIVLPFLR
jgi:hypothetical protein